MELAPHKVGGENLLWGPSNRKKGRNMLHTRIAAPDNSGMAKRSTVQRYEKREGKKKSQYNRDEVKNERKSISVGEATCKRRKGLHRCSG